MVENLKIQRILSPTHSSMKVRQPGEKRQNGQDRRFDRHLEKEENDEKNKRRRELIGNQEVDSDRKLVHTSRIVFQNDHKVNNEKMRQVDIIV